MGVERRWHRPVDERDGSPAWWSAPSAISAAILAPATARSAAALAFAPGREQLGCEIVGRDEAALDPGQQYVT